MVLLQETMDIGRGTTYQHTFYLLDNDMQALNTSMYTPKMFLKQGVDDLDKVDLSPYLDNTTYASSGIVMLSIPYDITMNIPFYNGVFDLLVQHTVTNEVFEIARGKFSTRTLATRI